jgi:hypothetical protein
MRLKDDYIAAGCCHPLPGDQIVGYYSYENVIRVHRADCANLMKAEGDRIVTLDWPDILAPEVFHPDDDFQLLDSIDYCILQHHQTLGVDYSLAVAAAAGLDQQTVFDRHAWLRERGLLQRVEPRMIQYRKHITKGKWIKHRNHTYYDLTEKGRRYLGHYRKQTGDQQNGE